MPKRIVTGAGMMQRHRVQYDRDEPGAMEACIDAWKAFAAQMPREQPGDMPGDALNRENAERCRAILATVGLDNLMEGRGAVNLGPLRERGLDEDSAQWIAAHWLAAYHSMMTMRAKMVAGDTSPSTTGMMLMRAQEMGRLQERMWWRSGIDPETGERRERLAIERRDHRRAFANAAAERQAINAERKEAGRALAALAQRMADECWQRNPVLSKQEVARRLHARWPTDSEIPRPSVNTIRQRIKRN